MEQKETKKESTLKKEFRAFDLVNKKWIKNNSFISLNGQTLLINSVATDVFDIVEGKKVERIDIMQYTGYIKEDQKLFEKDYVLVDFSPVIYEVEITPNCLLFKEVWFPKWYDPAKLRRAVRDFSYLLNHNISNCTIIGNFYDNNLEDLAEKYKKTFNNYKKEHEK